MAPREPPGLEGARPRAALGFTIAGGRIVAIEILADPERLLQLDVTLLED